MSSQPAMGAKDTSIKVEEPAAAGEGQFNLDGILSELGSFGKYQLALLLLLAFRDSFLAMCNFNYVFTAADVPFRCYVPECESPGGQFNASWCEFALGNASRACVRPAPLPPAPLAVLDAGACAPDRFAINRTLPCERIVYENYNSIVAEFDLGCQPWKRTLIGTVHNLGLVFSFILSGLISDRYGRKVVIVCTPLAVGTAGVLKSFVHDYWLLLALEFLETALGYGNASMVLSLEAVSLQSRVVFSCMADILSSVGSAFFGLIAWRVPYWRHLMRAIYAPLLVVVFYIFLMDEGVRWLIAHNRKDEAVRVLNKVAKINNITLSSRAREFLTAIEERSKAEQASSASESRAAAPWRALRSRAMGARVALMGACFVCCNFVYNGTIVNSGALSGDRHVNFSAMLLVSVPTRIVTALTLTRFGRKTPIGVAYSFCAVFFIASAFVPKSVWWASVVLYLAGKMCSSYGIFCVYVVSLEVFPTVSRNSLANLANTLGRLGSVLAPQAPLLEQYMSGLPSIAFGVAALGAAALSLLLPDTSRSALPDQLADAENLDAPRPSAA